MGMVLLDGCERFVKCGSESCLLLRTVLFVSVGTFITESGRRSRCCWMDRWLDVCTCVCVFEFSLDWWKETVRFGLSCPR